MGFRKRLLQAIQNTILDIAPGNYNYDRAKGPSPASELVPLEVERSVLPGT